MLDLWNKESVNILGPRALPLSLHTHPKSVHLVPQKESGAAST